MYRNIVIALVIAAMSVIAGCSTTETPSERPQTQTPASTPVETTSNLKEIQQQRSGDYVVVLLNETGDLKQGANDLALEFRSGSDNQLADVENVQVESKMEMQGMGPMLGNTRVTPSGTPGRYNVTSELSMAGDWKMAVMFGSNQKVEFNLAAR